MNENKVELTKILHLRYWVQHILPLVYDESLSYIELLAKVTYKVNELIENNNNLQEYIKEEITNYINSDLIKSVVTEVVSNVIIDVTNPPAGLKSAVGDNVTDNTEALQAIFDYAAENGKSVYFPKGRYITNNINAKDIDLYGAGVEDTFIYATFEGDGLKDNVLLTSPRALIGFTLDGRQKYQPFDNPIIGVNISNSVYAYIKNVEIKDILVCYSTAANMENITVGNVLSINETEVNGTNTNVKTFAAVNPVGEIRFNTLPTFSPACKFTKPFTIFVPGAELPNISGDNLTIINDETKSESHKNIIVNAPGDLTINAGDVTETAGQKTSDINGDLTKTISGKYKANISETTEIKGENGLFSISRNNGKTSINVTDVAIKEQSPTTISRAIGEPTQAGYINESITPGEYDLRMVFEDGVRALRLSQTVIALAYNNTLLGINKNSIGMIMDDFSVGLTNDANTPIFMITKGNNINDLLFSASSYLMTAYFPSIKIEVGDRAETTTGFKLVWDKASFNMIYPINNTKPCLRLDKDYFTIAPPIKYRTPASAGIWYDTIPVIGEDGNTYYAMVKNDSTPNDINGGGGAPTLVNSFTNSEIVTITRGGNSVINIGALNTPGTYAIQVNVESDSNYVNVFKLSHGFTKLGANIIAPTQEGEDNASGSGFYMFKFEGTPTQPYLNLTIYNYDQTNDMHVAIAGIDVKIWKF